MSPVLVVTFQEMDKVLQELGFQAVRQKGSHVFYRHPDGRTTTVPKHSRRDLARPLVRKILNDIELSSDEFQQILEGR